MKRVSPANTCSGIQPEFSGYNETGLPESVISFQDITNDTMDEMGETYDEKSKDNLNNRRISHFNIDPEGKILS